MIPRNNVGVIAALLDKLLCGIAKAVAKIAPRNLGGYGAVEFGLQPCILLFLVETEKTITSPFEAVISKKPGTNRSSE